MKPYDDLTHSGRLRRMRRLAEAALKEYGLAAAHPEFYLQAGNTLYRVRDPHPKQTPEPDNLFEPGQYLLRIYQPGWQTPEAIELELAWLAAMRGAGLPVPEPMPRLDGGLLTQVTVPGIPETRSCALLHWVKGKLLPNAGRPEHYLAQGRLMARMHNFTQQWFIPPASTKRHYNWEGLFMNDAEIGLPPGKSWEYLPAGWVEPFEIVSHQFRKLVEAWGTGPDVYGLIHADMGIKANLLFWRGQPRPIDFDGSGFGYWMYDLGVALTDCIGTPDYARLRAALLEGYSRERSLADMHLAKLDLFIAAFFVYYDLWVVGGTHDHPEYLNKSMEEQMHRGAAFVLGYAEENA